MNAILEYVPEPIVVELISRGIVTHACRMINGRVMDMVQNHQTGGVKFVPVRGARLPQLHLQLTLYSPIKWAFELNHVPQHLHGVVLCSAKTSPKVKLANGQHVQILSRHDAERSLWEAYHAAPTKMHRGSMRDLINAHRAAGETGVVVSIPIGGQTRNENG